jgi:hypothetical protein
MTHLRVFDRTWRVLIASLLCVQMLTACAKTGTASVSIHGVNYMDEVVSFRVEDPANENNHGGGGLIDPFAAGGTMCCYDLPKKWRPGIKIKIDVTRWLPKKADGSLPEVHENHAVEVPPYADGKVGELWVLRNADGTMSVVSSDYQPDHEKWPGKFKGWPVPSLAYQRERWDLYISLAESDVRLYKEMLRELETAPGTRAAEAWEFTAREAARYMEGVRAEWNERAKADRDLLARFTGSSDPKFHAWLKQDYEEGLKRSELKLKGLKESRP